MIYSNSIYTIAICFKLLYMNQVEILQIFEDQGVSDEKILSIAIETGLVKRLRLIKPKDILFSFCVQSIQGQSSFNNIASRIANSTGNNISRQAVHQKLKLSAELFFEKILGIIIKNKFSNEELNSLKRNSKYKRIIVQDSTIIKLPSRLFELFSGVSNGKVQVANARIQATYDLLKEEFIYFSIDSYSENDYIAAPKLKFQEGDLVLRDRGYLTVKEMARHISIGAYFIYRHSFNSVYLDDKTLEPIDITALLKKKGNLDITVRLNNEQKTAVRLVAKPVDKKLAQERRRKAKKNNKGKNPSKEYLEQLEWTIFIVTISKEDADFNHIFNLYSLRWRIEIIFKSWKSHMNFSKIHNVSSVQLRVIIISRFIMIILLTQYFFPSCRLIISKHLSKNLSLLKTINYLINNSNVINKIHCEIKSYDGSMQNRIKTLARYCCYDSRDRPDYESFMNYLFS